MSGSSGKVAIVGGGIAGLIAAVELARGGAKVTVFEAAAELGGRARTRHQDGFSLNQGPHAVYAKGALHRTLKRLGIAVAGQKANPAAPQGLRDGRLYRFPTSLGSLVFSGLFEPRDKADFSRVYQLVADGATGEGTYEAWLDAQKLRSRVRKAMEGIARVATYTNAPGLMSATAALEQMRLGGRGVIYVDGGWSSIVAALCDAAVEAGVDIRPGAGVQRIMVEGQRVRLALAGVGEHVADAALLAVGPKEALSLAPHIDSLRTCADEAIPMRANTLDLALERWPDGAREFVIGIDAPIYFSLHSKAAKLAPEGGAVVHVARYMAPHETVRVDAIEELEAVADLAMPGWRRLEKRRQTLRGITVSHALVRWDRPRPAVELQDARGLFIAGDWVGAEGMISDAAAASAVEATSRIVAMLASNGIQSAA